MDDSSIIHDKICKLINKKCHPKTYQSDIKYQMTLDMIFIVARLLSFSSFNHRAPFVMYAH